MGPRIVSNRERVIDPVTAYQVTSMMQGVVQRGTAAGTVGGAGIPAALAGKTGTTNDARDVWFVGFSSSIVAGCYIGYDQPRSLGRRASGGGMCGPSLPSSCARPCANTAARPSPCRRAACSTRSTAIPVSACRPEARGTRGLRAVPRGRGAVRGASGGDRRWLGHGLGPADVRPRRGRRRGRGLHPAGCRDDRAGGDDRAHLRRRDDAVPTGTGFGTLSAGGLY
jgi:membrane peptidoglycan carboxypeptidase